MMLLIDIIIIYTIVDFITGLVHWLEDTYADPNVGWMSKIADENKLHHDRPRAFLEKNWWQSSYDLVFLAATYCVVNLLWLELTWHDVFFAFCVANANQVHKWSHQNKNERPYIICLLQKYRVLQTPKSHAKHHSKQLNSDYCTFGNYLNPLLEKLIFWRVMEILIYAVAGKQPRQHYK